MALAYVTKTSLTPVLCSPGSEMVPGDQVRLALDTVVDPELPVSILGVVQNPVARLRLIDPTTGCAVSGYSYTIAFDAADLNGAMVDLTADLIISMECVTCCQLLSEQLAGKGNLAGGNDWEDTQNVKEVNYRNPSEGAHDQILRTFGNGISLIPSLDGVKEPDREVSIETITGPFGWDLSNGNLTARRAYNLPDANGTIPSVPVFADLVSANAALAPGKFFWNTTDQDLQQATV